MGGNTAKYTSINDAALKVVLTRKKKKNFIKPQYNSSLSIQHCGRLPEKTNVHHAGHLNKKNTQTEKQIIYEHKTTKKERTAAKSHNTTVIPVYQIQ